MLSQLTVLRSLCLATTRTMATVGGLSQLQDLDLAGNVLCTGIELELRCLPALRRLCVGLEQLTPGVAESLSGLWRLQRLDVRCRVPLLQLDPAGVAEFQHRAFVLDLSGNATLEAVLARAFGAVPEAVQAAHAGAMQAAHQRIAVQAAQEHFWLFVLNSKFLFVFSSFGIL